MRIAIIGAGGIGAIFGAALARSGAEVAFVARGAHLAAMRENGLRIEGDRGETLIRPIWATDDIAGIGPVDYVLLCVKLWDVETAGARLRPIVGRWRWCQAASTSTRRTKAFPARVMRPRRCRSPLECSPGTRPT